ncbi:hypothetical protein LEMLEM_LOCUS4085 [Lemmus lemmus]
MWSAWVASCGRCPWPRRPVKPSIRMSRCCAREPSWPSTVATTASFTISWKIISLLRNRTPSCRHCGLKRITRRQRSCVDGPWGR